MQKLRQVTRVLALSLLTFGCGADCESLCEDRKDCADSSPDERARDCSKTCEAEEKIVERFGCKPPSDDLIDCIASLDELCDPPPDACAGEQSALYQCNYKFCSEHPDDADCT
jgi:hypothetical protein